MSFSFELNNSSNACPLSLQWSQFVINSQRPLLYVCIIASITHSAFWIQFIFYPTLRQKTMQWLYAYLITDILLIFRFFFSFIVHTISKECIPNRIWSLSICYFEGVIDNYLNALEVYILLALNFGRYVQIAYNNNVYITHARLLNFTHLAIYLLPLINFIIQLYFGWASVNEYMNESCDVAYTNIYVQIFNIIFTFALPIGLNIFVIHASIRHVRLTSRLQRVQHRVSARQKYHRSLAMQFLIFYTIWLLLWSPNIIAFQLKSRNSNLMMILQLLNYIEIAIDPMIIGALDSRFRKVWCHIWKYFKRKLCRHSIAQLRRVEPNTITQSIPMRHQIRRGVGQTMT